ncbi:MAG: hypothetical protein OFPII_04000 [Osedax symbiont Rs1]|nr:MAG: hypothetical protein OFPII_04000 [Osedax symbiont Rs1]
MVINEGSLIDTIILSVAEHYWQVVVFFDCIRGMAFVVSGKRRVKQIGVVGIYK